MPLLNGTSILRTATGDIGVIVGYVSNHGAGVDVYRVKVGSAILMLMSAEFTLVEADGSLWDRLLGVQAVRLMMAEIKIVHPFRDTLASYGATKTELHAYQFKPLLKLNLSALNRILIADEVGLGKTIEAGYIIVEQIARDPYLPVVIICPPMLRPKWRAELSSRFGLQFQIMTSGVACQRIAHRKDEEHDSPLRAIVSYETIRARRFSEALKQSEEGHCSIGLLIADEAHRASNPLSQQSKALELLTSRAHTAAFLTATPVQNSEEDLFRLLQILIPDQFMDYGWFKARRLANELIVRAEVAVGRADLNELDASIEAFENVPHSFANREITENPYFNEALAQMTHVRDLVATTPVTDPKVSRERLELQDLLFKINLLSPILNRTRRRDVHSMTAQRSAWAIDATLTSYEQQVYDELTDAVFEEYTQLHGDQIARFVLKGFQRGFASSLWAAVSHYRERLQIEDADCVFDMSEMDLPSSWDADEKVAAVGDSIQGFGLLREVLARANLDRLWREDSKWKLLAKILEQHRSTPNVAGPRRKMLLFSYFKRSLDLVGLRLTEMGVKHIRIDGDVPMDALNPEQDQRQQRILKFRDDPTIEIMIASQVGCEGLDLQFCDTVVNWDLPWNPMTLEQRIGRIDRMGQKAEILHIVNIACKGTVEWDILHRLYNKIGIFKSSIGDLEEILGEVAEGLQNRIATTKLTVDARRSQIDAQALVLENVRRQREVLEQQASHLLTADSFLTDELDRRRRTGQLVQAHEVQGFACARIKQLDPASSFVPLGQENLWEFQPGPMFVALAENIWRSDRVIEWHSFLGRMRRGRPIACTFHGSQFEGRGEVEVLSAAHPLLRILVHGLDATERQPSSFCATIGASAIPEVAAGDWMMMVNLVGDSKESRSARIVAAAARLGADDVLDSDRADMLLNAALQQGKDLYETPPQTSQLQNAHDRAAEEIWKRFQSERDEIKKRGELMYLRRSSVLNAHHDRLIEIAERTLQTTRSRSATGEGAGRGVLLQEGRLKAAHLAKQLALAALPKASGSTLVPVEQFVGFIRVSADWK